MTENILPGTFTGLPAHTDKVVRELEKQGLARVFIIVEQCDCTLALYEDIPDDKEDWLGWVRVLALSKESALELYHNAHDQWASGVNGDPDWINCVLRDAADRLT